MKKERKERTSHYIDDAQIRETVDTKARCFEEDKDTLYTLASRINEEMSEQNISQEDFCIELGISQGALSNYRNGLRFPDGNVLYKMAKKFNVSSDYLLGLTSLRSIDKDYQKVHNLTGLSDNAIKVLEKLLIVHKENLSINDSNNSIKDLIDTISYLIEKEDKHFLFSSIANYLWFETKHKELLDKYGNIEDDYGFIIERKKISIIDRGIIDDTLLELKQEIENGK